MKRRCVSRAKFPDAHLAFLPTHILHVFLPTHILYIVPHTRKPATHIWPPSDTHFAQFAPDTHFVHCTPHAKACDAHLASLRHTFCTICSRHTFAHGALDAHLAHFASRAKAFRHCTLIDVAHAVYMILKMTPLRATRSISLSGGKATVTKTILSE